MEHYKMYKAGKNWMVAGLMTTAALAGLTLANVNNTANADQVNNNEAVAAVSAQPAATPTEIQSAQSAVNSTSANVASQAAVVSADSEALSSAQQLNAGSTAVSEAENNYNSAYNAWSSASAAVGPVSSKSQKAASAASAAQEWANWWNDEGGQTVYNRLTGLKSSNQAALSEAQALQPSYSDAWNSASTAYDQVLNDSNATSAQKHAAKLDKEDAYNKMMDVNSAAKSASDAITHIDRVLAGSDVDNKLGQSVNFNYGSEQVAKLPELKQAASDAHSAFLAASQAAADANVIAENAYKKWANAREEYNLPKSKELAKLKHDAAGVASKIAANNAEINNMKTSDGTNFKSAQQYASDAAVKVGIAQNDVSDAQSDVDLYTNKLAAAQSAESAAQLAYENKGTDLNKKLLTTAKENTKKVNNALTAAKQTLSDKQAALKKAQFAADYWADQVNGVKNSARYQKLIADNAYRQSIADRYNQAKSNLADAATAAGRVAAAQTAYDNAKTLLTAYTNQYNKAVEILNSLTGQTANNSQKYGDQLNKGGNTIYTKPAAQAASVNASATANAAANDEVTTVVSAPTPAEVAGANVPVDAISSVVWTDPAFVNNAVAQGAGTYKTQVTVNWADGSTPTTIDWNLIVRDANSDNTNPGDNTNNSTNNNTTNGNQNTVNNGVVNGFTGVNGNNYYVNGQQVTKAQYEAYVANKAQQNGAQATTAALPQTGNENSAAIVALGAVSAMFGLGLAAKKREF